MAAIAVGCSHVSGLLVQPFSRLLALMWFAKRVLIKFSGSTPVTQQKVLPPRRPTDRHHAISTSATVTPYGVFLSLWRWNRAPRVAAITPLPSPYLVAAHASARHWGARWAA